MNCSKYLLTVYCFCHLPSFYKWKTKEKQTFLGKNTTVMSEMFCIPVKFMDCGQKIMPYCVFPQAKIKLCISLLM